MAKNKAILVGIDFTKSSDNACRYAAMLAAKGSMSLILFHVYDVPVIHTYSGAYFVSFSELHQVNSKRLDKYKEKIQKAFPQIEISTIATYKSARTKVEELNKNKRIHSVILGLETKSRISKFIYGSTGTDIAGRVECPVIIVPQSYKTHKLSILGVAVDNRKSLNMKVINKLKEFYIRLKADIRYVHIKTESEFDLGKNGRKGAGIKPDLVEAKDFPTGIGQYARKNNIDMVVILSHSHSVLYNFFNESNTKKVAFLSKVPVMAIHD